MRHEIIWADCGNEFCERVFEIRTQSRLKNVEDFTYNKRDGVAIELIYKLKEVQTSIKQINLPKLKSRKTIEMEMRMVN
jgi:hypothetical protein